MTDYHDHFIPDTVDEQVEQLSHQQSPDTSEKRMIATLHRLHRTAVENDQEIIERAWQRATQSVAQNESESQHSVEQNNHVVASPSQTEEKAPIYLHQHISMKKRGSYRALNVLAAVLVLGLLLASWGVMLNKVYPDLNRQPDINNTTTQTPPSMAYVGTGATVAKLDPRTGKTIWRYNVGNAISAKMQVVDDVVYIATYSNGVFALNANSGKLLWHSPLSDNPYLPQIANGIYYVTTITTRSGTLYALDLKNGAVRWSKSTSKMPSFLVKDDLLYLKTLDNNLQALNATTGSPLWSYREASISLQEDFFLTLTYQNGVIYDSSANHIYALSAREGKELWNVQLAPGQFVHSLALANGNIYVSSTITRGVNMKNYDASFKESRLYAFNASTGKVRWTSEKGYNFMPWLPITGNIIFAYAGLSKPTSTPVTALDANSGKLRWKWDVSCTSSEKCPETVPLLLKGNILYLLAENAFSSEVSPAFLAIDITTGKLLWQRTQDLHPTSLPITEKDGIMYFVSSGDKNPANIDFIRAYSLKTQAVLWTTKIENGYTRPDRAYSSLQSLVLAP